MGVERFGAHQKLISEGAWEQSVWTTFIGEPNSLPTVKGEPLCRGLEGKVFGPLGKLQGSRAGGGAILVQNRNGLRYTYLVKKKTEKKRAQSPERGPRQKKKKCLLFFQKEP